MASTAKPAAAESSDATTKPEAAPKGKAKLVAPGPVPASEIPMCWVSAPDSDTPYLINVADFDAAKHLRLE